MSKAGEACSAGALPCGAPAGACFPLSKPFNLMEGKRGQQDVPSCWIRLYVSVWLVSAGSSKIFPVEGAGSLALHIAHI